MCKLLLIGMVSSFYFIFLSSQVELKEMSFQLLLENWQGSSIPDGGDGTTRRRSLADLRLLEGM